MIPGNKRKSIAKSFIFGNYHRQPELWKNYKAVDEKGFPKSWCPIPCPWDIFKGNDAIIGVGETLIEAQEIAKLEVPENRLDMVDYSEYEYVDGKKYFVFID